MYVHLIWGKHYTQCGNSTYVYIFIFNYMHVHKVHKADINQLYCQSNY